MTDPITLELRDPEAILRGSGQNEGGLTRFELLGRAALGGSALIGVDCSSGVPKAYAQSSPDIDILDFLLLNESLEGAFYTEALRRGRSRVPRSPAILAAALAIDSVEGRHTGWTGPVNRGA